jgi:hypothetical protein
MTQVKARRKAVKVLAKGQIAIPGDFLNQIASAELK